MRWIPFGFTCLFAVICTILLAGCGTRLASGSVQSGTFRTSESVTLTVFAAASLTEAFTEIGQVFEAEHPGVRIRFNFAGSQQLAQQLIHGAPADLFASANEKQMQTVIEAGRIGSGSQQVFAHNRLVIIYSKDDPVAPKTLKDLSTPGLRLILAARENPAGQYAISFLEQIGQNPAFGPGFVEDVLANVVSYEENVRAVWTKISLGEADAGIVYFSDSHQDTGRRVGHLDITPTLNTMATYLIAQTADGSQQELAQDFIQLLASPKGQEALTEHGFLKIEDHGPYMTEGIE